MFKKRAQIRQQTKLERRASLLATSEMTQWLDQSFYHIGKYVAAWQRTGEKAYIEEAKSHADVVHTLIREMERRAAL